MSCLSMLLKIMLIETMLIQIMLIEIMLIEIMLIEIMLIKIMLIKITLIKIIFDRTGVLIMLNTPLAGDRTGVRSVAGSDFFLFFSLFLKRHNGPATAAPVQEGHFWKR